MDSKRNYWVYFEIGGKFLKKKVFATSEHQAKQLVLDSVKFNKVEFVKGDSFNESMDILEQFNSYLKK